jgi:hypothetical protein
MSIKSIFLQQTDSFIDELCNIFSNNNDILLFSEKYYFVKNANSKIVIEYFIEYIYPLKNKIMEKDETFFLDGGGQEELKDNSGLKLRDNIKKLWMNDMSNENKEIVWKYFKIFIILCEKYIIENIKK